MAIRWLSVTAGTESNFDSNGQGPFRLLQISDCHLSGRVDALYRGRNADAGLEAVVARVVAWHPNLVMATGDLSEDASPAAYQRLADCLARFEVPMCVLPGNHDDDALAGAHFPDGPWQGPRLMEAGAWRLVLLKTSVTGRIDGAIDSRHLEHIAGWLEDEPAKPFLLALHHQPVPVGSPWIDRHMLQAPQAFLKLVESRPQIRAVVWGHVHQAFESRLGSARMLSCPSTAANSLPAVARFTDDPAGPACRWLLLHADGTLDTGLAHAEKCER